MAPVCSNDTLNPRELAVLQSLYRATGGYDVPSAWGSGSHWNFSAGADDPCKGGWFGIDSNSTTKVDGVRLNISSVCTPPDSATRCRSLQVLMLSNPHPKATGGIHGNISAVNLGHLTALKVLQISKYNEVSGAIPPLNALTALQVLDMSFTDVELGDTNFDGQGALRFLDLTSISIRGGRANRLPSFAALTSMQTVKLFNASLVGTIPSIESMTALTTLNMPQNDLTGTLPSFASQGGELTAMAFWKNRLEGSIPTLKHLTMMTDLTLQNNLLSGTIPALESLTVLNRLTLHNNHLEGSVPVLPQSLITIKAASYNGGAYSDSCLPGCAPKQCLPPLNVDSGAVAACHKGWAIWKQPQLTLYNNHLSCALPDIGIPRDGRPGLAVVAFGNKFTHPAPSWVPASSRGAGFLFVTQGASWHWILVYIGVGAVLLSAIVTCAVRRAAMRSTESQRASEGSVRRGSSFVAINAVTARTFLPLQLGCTIAIAALSCFSLVTLLPIYASAPKLYDCGESLMHTSISYMASNSQHSGGASVFFSCAFAVASALALRWLSSIFDRSTIIKAAPGPRFTIMNAVVGFAAVAWFARWLIFVLLLNVPTVLYVISLYLPADNALGIGKSETSALRHGLPLFLAAINSAFLPTLTRVLLCRHDWGLLRRLQYSEATVVSRLLLLGRLLSFVVIPVGAVIFLSDGCYANWTYFWTVCHSKSTLNYTAPTGCHPPTSVACQYYIPQGHGAEGAYTTNVQEICDGTLQSGALKGMTDPRCVRDVLDALLPILSEKFAIAVFLQPACMLWAFQSGLSGWLSRHIYGHASGKFHQGVDFEVAALFAQVEIAFVYGFAFPILLLLATMSMAVHWLAFAYIVAADDVVVLPLAMPPIRYLHIALLLQAALATWLFTTTQSAGAGAIVGVVAFGCAVGASYKVKPGTSPVLAEVAMAHCLRPAVLRDSEFRESEFVSVPCDKDSARGDADQMSQTDYTLLM